jgi:hypothetical protein
VPPLSAIDVSVEARAGGIQRLAHLVTNASRPVLEGRLTDVVGQDHLVGPDGTLYAHASTTCLVFELPAQSRG